MKKTIQIEFSGQSKGVVAKSKVEYELDSDEAQTVTNAHIIKEAKDLYNEVNAHADILSRSKK